MTISIIQAALLVVGLATMVVSPPRSAAAVARRKRMKE